MTKFEVVVPCEWGSEAFKTVLAVFEKNARSYAWARHPADENASFEHWHIGGELHSNRNVDDIYKWFAGFDRVKKNSIQNIKSHWKTYLTYIMHKTKDAIAKGKSEPTERGGNADFETALKDYETKGECDNLIADILAGRVLEYQFHMNTPLVEAIIQKGWYTKVKQAFESAEKSRLARSSSISEERKQCWIFGKAGSGKTELAKWFCRSQGFLDIDIYVTSSGQNPFDDYKGQPCIIVDDIDADTMTAKTALKLADCFTGSAVKARYSNKVIFAKMVVFTSTIAPQNWWKGVAAEKVDGNVHQLLRRLNLGSWLIEDNSISATMYDGQGEIDTTVSMEMPAEVMEKVRSKRTASTVDFLGSVFTVKGRDEKTGVTANVQISFGKDGGFIE